MADELQTGESAGEQSQGQPAFKPAANPFEQSQQPSVPPSPVAPQAPEKKKSAFSLGFGKKKEEPEGPQLTEANVAGKNTTLVGHVAESRHPDAGKPQAPPPVPEETLFRWQAPEFVYTNKPAGWFIGIGVFFLILVGLAIWFQQWISVVLLIVMAIALGVWANRKPHILEYGVSNYGIYVNNKKYLFDDFRGFYDYMDYNQKTLDLIPSKKIGTLVSMPLATPDADAVIDTLSKRIPKIEHEDNPFDELVRKLRF